MNNMYIRQVNDNDTGTTSSQSGFSSTQQKQPPVSRCDGPHHVCLEISHVSQCVAVCCNWYLDAMDPNKCVNAAVCRSVLRCVAVCGCVVQCGAECCSGLQQVSQCV